MNSNTIPTAAVLAEVGPDVSGVTVISAGGSNFYDLPTDHGMVRVYSGLVAAEYTDLDRIARIVAVAAGCDVSQVNLLIVSATRQGVAS